MRRTVKRILDGDTFIVNRKIGNTKKVRVAGFNAPERNRPGGSKATNRLRGLIGDKQVTVIPRARSYDRVVADVRINRKFLSKAMRRK